MKRQIVFTIDAFDQLLKYQTGEQKLIIKILSLIESLNKNPETGLGKPEALKGKNFEGIWSREIDPKNRLVYRWDELSIYILFCRGHYHDK